MPNDLLQQRTEVLTECFKRGVFEPFVEIDGEIHQRQKQALCILVDSITEEFGYGGAAGGAKSWTGCTWEAMMCLAYPGTRYFIGREELKRLRESTYQTFLKVCKRYGIKQDVDWKYNGQDHFIQFKNGSRIDLLDLKFLPRDPLYERYGSTEYTAGWIEEGGEVHFAAYDTLKTRVGRQLNDKYGILGKLFVTLNPKKNWCHSTFWKPFKAGTLPKNVKFLQSLVTDNPFVDSGYIAKLRAIKDKVRKQRLLLGNFDYDDDDNALMDYDSITDIFYNEHAETGRKYITADIARFGKDKSVIMVWDGWRVIGITVMKHKKVPEVAMFIKSQMRRYEIPKSQVVVDDDGVGGGVVDLVGCKGFVNNSSPLELLKKSDVKVNYRNLKSQCYYMLSADVNEKKVYVQCTDEEIKEALTEELEQVKKKDPDSDTKLEVVPKDEVKELLGRSPDYSDTLMMREYFELKPKRRVLAA
jgi:hypothetical protein